MTDKVRLRIYLADGRHFESDWKRKSFSEVSKEVFAAVLRREAFSISHKNGDIIIIPPTLMDTAVIRIITEEDEHEQDD